MTPRPLKVTAESNVGIRPLLGSVEVEKWSVAKVEVRGITSDIDQAVDGAQRSHEALVTHFGRAILDVT